MLTKPWFGYKQWVLKAIESRYNDAMKCIIQRVLNASVTVEETQIAAIGIGCVVLLGIEENDTSEDIAKMVKKITELRIFSNQDGKFDQSLKDINGDLLIVSQFTLMADCKKGRRPNFLAAAPPKKAQKLCDEFIHAAKTAGIGDVQSGAFGANMQVSLINDGPVTIPLNSDDI